MIIDERIALQLAAELENYYPGTQTDLERLPKDQLVPPVEKVDLTVIAAATSLAVSVPRLLSNAKLFLSGIQTAGKSDEQIVTELQDKLMKLYGSMKSDGSILVIIRALSKVLLKSTGLQK
jgi:hypothetical protein